VVNGADACIVLTTAPSKDVATKIARELVESRLAACVHIGNPGRSVYRWNDAVEEAEEWPLTIKTSARAVEGVGERVRALHPYELPELLVLGVDSGSQAYLSWIGDVVR
jgi:periplasmic divalent cation tolerance protein